VYVTRENPVKRIVSIAIENPAPQIGNRQSPC
jgi:hypothetical protein